MANALTNPTNPIPSPTSVPPGGSASRRGRSLAIWGLCCLLAAGIFGVYLAASLAAGHGNLLMPLDDVYIHFQYAHQLANGQPYIYNPGLPPTSGATSFLYPYILALGVLLGFDGLRLGLWAMIVGALALAGSAWLVVALGRRYASDWIAVLFAAAFALAGPVSWHFMSGMETGLVVLFVLWTLLAVQRLDVAQTAVAATLLSLVRPEGGALATLAVLTLILALMRDRRLSLPGLLRACPDVFWLALPVLAIGVQPLVNLALTRSLVASGNQAKSVLGMVPPYHDAIIATLLSNFARMGLELLTSLSSREGWYYPFTLSLLALVGLVRLLRRRDGQIVALLLILWLLVTMAAVATLDTAFWHFKRYQMPMIALLFPLAAWGVGLWPRRGHRFGLALAGLTAVLAALTFLPFRDYYTLNVGYVYAQPLQMARWLETNTPPDSVVAVHDTGMMRYMGGRTTVDIVGLTTAGAATAWRNGPGAVAEYLDDVRPDYIASYGRGHGYGLGYLADTSLYANALVEYPVTLDNAHNVALAADVQGIYAPDWGPSDRSRTPAQPSIRALLEAHGATLMDEIDVASIVSENAHHYAWRDAERLGGFPTDVYDQSIVGCGDSSCRLTDGGRHINGEESFDFVPPTVSKDMLLVTRVHAVNPGTYTVYVNDTPVATRWLPQLPGAWLEIPVLLPSELLTTPTRIRIVPATPGGHYMPYHHWLYSLNAAATLPESEPFATFQEGRIQLYNPVLTVDEAAHRLRIGLTWQTPDSAEGDYKLFVHVLGPDETIIAQADQRPGSDTLPPGNWIDGAFDDTIMVDLADAPSGRYRVMIGLYDPVTFARLTPSPGDDAQRLLLGEVEINGNG